MGIQLYIDDALHTFEPLQIFRTSHDLPPSFTVAHFESKDYTGLGSIERAGASLNVLRERLLGQIPKGAIQLPDTLALTVAGAFEHNLRAINGKIGLREPEIAFARASFEDILRAYALAHTRAHLTRQAAPDFDTIYSDWLNQTVRVSTHAHRYMHHDEVWVVQVITHAFGRIGLRVKIGDDRHYVADLSLACPAEGFTVNLLRTLCQQINTASNESHAASA